MGRHVVLLYLRDRTIASCVKGEGSLGSVGAVFFVTKNHNKDCSVFLCIRKCVFGVYWCEL